MMVGVWVSNDTCRWFVVVFAVTIGLGRSGGARSVMMLVNISMMWRNSAAWVVTMDPIGVAVVGCCKECTISLRLARMMSSVEG